MKKMIKLVGALSLTVTHFAFGAQTLSLDEAIHLGLKKSENVEQAVLEIEKAEAQIREAWASVYPKFNATVQSTRNFQSQVIQTPTASFRVNQDWSLSTGLTLNQVLYTFGKVSTALDMAKTSRVLNETAKDQVEREIRYAVEVAYYNALFAQEVLRIAKDSYENARNNQKALRQRFQGGRVPRFDNIKMAADVAGRLPIVRNAEKNLTLAYLQLNLLVEADTNDRPVLTTKMNDNFKAIRNEKELVKTALEGPSLKVQDLTVELMDKQAQLKQADHYPSINLIGNITHSGTGDDMRVDEDNMFTASSLAVAVSIPIFSGGETTAQHRQAILEKTKAQVERKNLEKNLGLSIRSSLEEYETNIEKYKSAKEAANLANQAYKLTRARFATGGATRYDLNDSENALTNARIQLESTKFEIYQNKSNIKKLTQKVVKK